MSLDHDPPKLRQRELEVINNRCRHELIYVETHDEMTYRIKVHHLSKKAARKPSRDRCVSRHSARANARVPYTARWGRTYRTWFAQLSRALAGRRLSRTLR
ncbi:hypothetical protein EVAR_18506_1 [Eumeta japonica]|uniref:Uncharacterized protein n=1 Tax=Eumeta variegata TaxID=151549 RepID=A0A4C1V123_EUMVA|nr:hypothetical protein EVAR_18506_1 [Eumeta japonica]